MEMDFTVVTNAVTAAGTMISGLIGSGVEVIMSYPLLLLPVGVSFVGIGYGFAKSFLRV